MGNLVSIIGNSGVGKTTLTERLAGMPGFFAATEDLDRRPFQEVFSKDLQRYALANQIDFLLYRAEQETQIRAHPGIGLQDGGLDLDFHLFTRLFHRLGYLQDEEFALCSRLYDQLRSTSPPPDLFIYLNAPIDVVAQRYRSRNRIREIASVQNLKTIQSLLDEWLSTLNSDVLINVDASRDSYAASEEITQLSQLVRDRF